MEKGMTSFSLKRITSLNVSIALIHSLLPLLTSNLFRLEETSYTNVSTSLKDLSFHLKEGLLFYSNVPIWLLNVSIGVKY